MPEELIPIVIVPFFLGTIAFIIKVLSDNRVKRELINMRADKETIDYLILQAPAQNKESSLKWGMVSIALGISFAVIQVFGLDGEQPMTYAVVFIFGGAGLFGYYLLKTLQEAK